MQSEGTATNDRGCSTHFDATCLFVSEWNFVKEDSIFKLKRTRKVKTFTKGLEFFKIVADLAESEGEKHYKMSEQIREEFFFGFQRTRRICTILENIFVFTI